MIIVSGWLKISPGERAAYVDECTAVVAAARAAPGCIDFAVSADPIDPDRVNVFEQWTDAESVETFRGSGPSDEQQRAIIDAHVEQHEVARTTRLT